MKGNCYIPVQAVKQSYASNQHYLNMKEKPSMPIKDTIEKMDKILEERATKCVMCGKEKPADSFDVCSAICEDRQVAKGYRDEQLLLRRQAKAGEALAKAVEAIPSSKLSTGGDSLRDAALAAYRKAIEE